ncbi:MAG: hypothetical protein ABIT07_04335, partial [Ferruginibacter sp.]
FTFFRGSNFFTDQIAKDPSAIRYLFAPVKEVEYWYNSIEGDINYGGYFVNPSGNMVMKISAIISYVAFNKYLIVSLFFGFFSFAGQWKLFLVFDELNKNSHRKLLAFATLYTPSIWFWGSGLLKDPICLGAVGFIVHILFKLFVKKKFSLADLLFMGLLLYIVTVIKSYIIIILLVSIGALILAKFFRTVKSLLFRIILFFIALGLFAIILTVSNFTQTLNELTEESVLQIQTFQNNYQATQEEVQTSKGSFGIGEVNPSLGSILIKSPLVIFTCLYRPFLWESRSIMIFFTSLESMLLLYYTLYLLKKTKLTGFFKAIFSNRYLIFCFILSMLFSLIIGFTTFNFGTMVRYKIIFLPFFYFMLVQIFSTYRNKNNIVLPD